MWHGVLKDPQEFVGKQIVIAGGDSAVDLATAGKIDLTVPFQLKALEGKEDQPGQLSSVVVCSLQGKFTTFLRIVYCLSLACPWI